MSIGIRFPYQETEIGGLIKATDTTPETVQSNLIAFLTLRKGQRPMRNDLYSPLYDYIFQPWDDISESELYDALESKLRKYFPEIALKEIQMNYKEEEKMLDMKIVYTIPTLGVAEYNASLSFDTSSTN
jgi:phage baseplate assembly protein W